MRIRLKCVIRKIEGKRLTGDEENAFEGNGEKKYLSGSEENAFWGWEEMGGIAL